MKKIFLFLSVVVLLISGCSFDVHVITPVPMEEEVTLPPVTPIIFPVSETPFIPTDTPFVGFTPVPGFSLFYGARAVENPYDQSGRYSFPAGTKRIYVVWNYQNMRTGLTVKREWYLDGKLWLQREEPWDFEKYGAFGTIQDISIYDENVGLPSGMYQLKIYIDGLLQPIGAPTAGGAELWFNFEVQPEGVFSEAASPDLQWSAVILGEKRLIVRDKSGAPTDLFAGTQIPDMAWFPDSQHILFIDRESTGDQLWVADIQSRETTLLVQSDTKLGGITGLVISPDGHYIATSEGAGGDACFMPLHLLFIEMGATYKGARVFYQKQFTGLPVIADSSVYPGEVGSWRSNTQFVSPIKFTCVTDESLAGNYVFDLPTLTATKK